MTATRGMVMVLVTAAVLGLTAGTAGATTVGSQFDPADYGSLADLTPTTSVDFFTGDGTNAPTVIIDAGTPIVGTTATSESGNVEMALFAFDTVDIGSGVTVNVTGNRGLVIASKGNLTFSSTLSLNGGATGYGTTTGGAGGPGAEGGTPGASFNSGAAGASQDDRGDGGDAAPGALDGIGYGGGDVCDTWSSSSPKIQVKGVGASYGGLGGTPPETDPGETTGTTATYGDEEMTDLYGGSGGSSSNKQESGRAGGGGGGAIELTAAGTLTLDGTLEAKGGKTRQSGKDYGGGGGSGGGILLTAPEIVFTGVVDVSGGPTEHRDDHPRSGGAGGGGRVAFYTDNLVTPTGEVLDVLLPLEAWPLQGGGEVIFAGGTSEGNYPGSEGSFHLGPYNLAPVIIPEPLSAFAVLLGAGALGGYLRRRRRGRMPAAGMLLVAAAAVALMAGTAGATLLTDFEAGSASYDNADPQTTGLFRDTRNGDSLNLTSNGAGNDYVASPGDESGQVTMVYDTTPATGGQDMFLIPAGATGILSVDTDMGQRQQNRSSMWIGLLDPGAGSTFKGVLAYYTARNGSAGGGIMPVENAQGDNDDALVSAGLADDGDVVGVWVRTVLEFANNATNTGAEVTASIFDLDDTAEGVAGDLLLEVTTDITYGTGAGEFDLDPANTGLGIVLSGQASNSARHVSFDYVQFDVEAPAVIPEPLSAFAVLLGAGAVGGYLRRRSV